MCSVVMVLDIRCLTLFRRFMDSIKLLLARYKLDVAGVQEVRWDKGGTVRAGDYNFFL